MPLQICLLFVLRHCRGSVGAEPILSCCSLSCVLMAKKCSYLFSIPVLIAILLLLFPPAGEIHILLKQLVLFGYDEQAGALQQVLEEVLQLMVASVPEIWTPDLQQSSVSLVCARPQYLSLSLDSIKCLVVFCILWQRA